MEDCARSRVDVMPAYVAAIGGTALDPVMFGDAIADLTVDALRVQVVLQPFETRGVVGEVPFEVAERVSFHASTLP